MEEAHGVQLVTVEDDHSYHLNEAELEKILMSEDIKDLPVAVVSVVGAYRGGKSFLLNFFLRYLSSSPSARSDGTWIGEDNKDLTGFSWRGGSQRNTTGILMWSEPFVITLPSGEKVAVLLMDTQGTFDSTSTVRDCSTIFALSSLLSSTQIYNIKSNINEGDLQNLQLFTEYGKLMKDQNKTAFQTLEFLVRDWMNPWEYYYGQAGGELYLANKFKVDGNLAPELRELRQHILASFEKVTCFLMPHPGLGVANTKFKGKTNEMSKDFVNELKELAASIFSPEKLCMKRISGQLVKSRELCGFFKSYMTVFNSKDIPSPTGILEATANAGLLMATSLVREKFEKNMESSCGLETPSMPAAEVNYLHQQELATARASFKAKNLLGNQKEVDKKLEELIQVLANRLKYFIEINQSKTLKAIENGNAAYDKAIEDVTKGKPLCVHTIDLNQIQYNAVAAALKAFNDNRKIGHDGQDSDKDKYEKDLTEKYDLLLQRNEHNNKRIVAELKAEYFQYMLQKVNSVPNLCQATFDDEHEQAKTRVLQEFESRRNLPNSYSADVYKSDLQQNIDLQYIQTREFNDNANNELLKTALMTFNEKSTQLSDLRRYCMHPNSLRKKHEAVKELVFNMISPKQLCGDNYRILNRVMQNHFEEIKAINDSANEQAVTNAFWDYRREYDKLSDHWYWAFTSWNTARKYHDKAMQVAWQTFYRRRDSYFSEGFDFYKNDLISRCASYFKNS